jgi:hypothetical protein
MVGNIGIWSRVVSVEPSYWVVALFEWALDMDRTVGMDVGGCGCVGIRAIPLWAVDGLRLAVGLDSRSRGNDSGVRAGDGRVRGRCELLR